MSASLTQPAPMATNRWAQLIIAIVCMVLIANYQYSWTLFVHPIAEAHKWDLAAIQVAFSIFVALETWLTPVDGWIADALGYRGIKYVVAGGAVLVAAGWVLNSMADSLGLLYLGSALSGTGAGAIYTTCVGNATKWFADRRGLAVGLTAAGFGAGAVFSVIPIRMVIAAHGYETAFLWFGLAQGIGVFILAWFLRAPLPGEARLQVNNPLLTQTTRSYTPAEMLRTPTFWLLYVMFVLIAASGLMAVAQIALIARSYGIADQTLFLGASVLTVTLLFDNACNGLARPFFGWVSDNIGRENTMAIAFAIGGAGYWLLGGLGHHPWLFVLFAGLIFFTWGEIFSLFPSTCTDSFGPKYATVNLSFLYTAKGAAAFLVPLANVIKQTTGSWHMVFVITAIANFVVVALALFVLKPLRRHQVATAGGRAEQPVTASAGPHGSHGLST